MKLWLLVVLLAGSPAESPEAPGAKENEWAWLAGGAVAAVAGTGLMVWGVQSGDLPMASAAVAASTVLWSLAAIAIEHSFRESPSPR